MVVYYGYNPPFIGGLEGILSRQEDERLIKNDILQLLLTLPGERVHEPNFGTRLRAAPFEPLDDVTMSALRTEILAVLEREELRITQTQVFLKKDEQQLQLRVTVSGVLSFDPNVKLLVETAIPITGGNT